MPLLHRFPCETDAQDRSGRILGYVGNTIIIRGELKDSGYWFTRNPGERARRYSSQQMAMDAARLATDPPVSEKQRKAMYAAASGHSTLGIPKSVGEEFVGKAHDGKNIVQDMSDMDWAGLVAGLLQLFSEEAEEPEHQEDRGHAFADSRDDAPLMSGAPPYQAEPQGPIGVSPPNAGMDQQAHENEQPPWANDKRMKSARDAAKVVRDGFKRAHDDALKTPHESAAEAHKSAASAHKAAAAAHLANSGAGGPSVADPHPTGPQGANVAKTPPAAPGSVGHGGPGAGTVQMRSGPPHAGGIEQFLHERGFHPDDIKHAMGLGRKGPGAHDFDHLAMQERGQRPTTEEEGLDARRGAADDFDDPL